MKVGIDLSSTNTGLVILSDDNKLIFHGNFKLWDNSSQKPLRVMVAELIDAIEFKLINKSEQVFIGIELSDFKNAMLTTRFNLIAGAIFQELYHRIWDTLGNFKLFNSNEWQRFLLEKYKPNIFVSKEIVGYKEYDDGDGYIDKVPIYKTEYMYRDIDCKGAKPLTFEYNERILRKTLSRLYTKQHCLEYQDTWTEDECDAYCIAYFLPQLRDRTQMHQEVKAKKVQAKKSKVQELREKLRAYNKAKKLYEIVNHYKDLANVKKLTKSQQRALEKAEMELKEYE